MDDNNETHGSADKVKSVARNILDEFFDTLEQEGDLAEIAPALRKLILDDDVFAEPSIRAALFLDAS